MSANTEKTASGIGSFYIVDLVKKLFKAKNISALIYLFLNVGIIIYINYALTGILGESILYGVIFYAAAAFIALSPVGEFILRLTQGYSKIRDDKILSRLEPLFFEVLDRAKAKKTDYVIGDNICLYIKDDPDPNACAIGRRSVCVTTGLLSCSNEEIKAILGHEIGHLASHDTDLVLLITVGNFLISAIVTIFRIVIMIAQLFFSIILSIVGGSEGLLASIITTVSSFLTLLFVNLIMYIWTKLGILLVMHSSRKTEYEADAFACDLGYTDGLLSFFKKLDDTDGFTLNDKSMSFIDRMKEKTKVFAALSSSHPATKDRIQRILDATATPVSK